MGGGGKSQTTTQQVSIPPEVLARYNAVNARAENVASQPFQRYSNDPNAFVAPLTQSQQQGIAQTQQYAQAAQPAYQQAQGQLQNAYQQGMAQTQAAYQPLAYGYQAGQQYGNIAGQTYAGAAGQAQPYYQAATQGLAGGMQYAQGLQQQAQQQAAGAAGAAAPLQGFAGEAITGAAAGAAPANQAAMQLGLGAGAAAAPYYGAATAGTQGAVQAGQQYLTGATGSIAGAAGQASPYYEQATSGTQAALDVASPYFQAATQGLGAAQATASPYFDAATAGTAAALQAGQPMQSLAQQAALAGARGVSPEQFNQQQIDRYMSPFMSNVVGQTMAAQAQQNAQQRAALTGEAIRAGAFGGDRAGIAQANLAYQQNLANQQTIANLLQSGYGQALGAFQQQQGVNLAAEQANRAAQQQLAQQALAIGQQGYGQNLGAAQQMANLGATQFQQGLAGAQTMANLGQNLYGQRLGAAQQMAGLGKDLYGQGITSGQALATLGQQAYGQQLGAAQQMAGLGKDLFGQNVAQGQMLSQLGQTQFGQDIAGGQAAQQLAQQQYAQQMANAQFSQGLGAQGFQQGLAASQQQQALGQGLAGLQFQTGQAMQNLGAQQAQLGQSTSAQQAALAQQGYGMGAGTAQAGAALGAGAQAAGLQGAQAMLGAGQIQQQTEQAGKQALYNQFLQEMGFPYQQAQFLANIAMGTGALSGSTTTTTQPAAFFSDRRVKEDIRKIGETEDGLPIHKFRYKGEDKDQTHIGYMADEVEKKHPDAVGEVDGVKYVDYAKVNERESMGGAVHGGGLGRAAYAYGGADHISPTDLQAIIQQQQQMYGPALGGLYGSSASQIPGGGKAPVPAGGLHVGKLATAGALPRQQQSGLDQGMDAAQKAKNIMRMTVGEYNPKTEKYEGGIKDTFENAKKGLTGLFSGGDKAAEVVENAAKNADELEGALGAFRASGGLVPRVPYKFGGGDMYETESSYIPEEVLESDEKTPELMTAKGSPGGGGGGKSGLGTALGAAGTLASFIPGVGPAIGAGMKLASAFMADGGVVPRDGYKQGGEPELSDEEYAIRTAAAEMSRSADPLEAIGIVSTIQNRRQSGEYGNTYRDVVLAPKQFEPWATTNNNPLNIRPDDPRYVAATEAFRKVQEEGVPEQFKNVYNFWGPKSQEALGRQPPSWGRVGGLDIGGTRFHTLDEVNQSRGMPREAGAGAARAQMASSQPQVASAQAAAPSGGEKGGIGDFLTSSKFLVPLGTGLLTMASSPSRYLGAAALQGLGAGLAAMNVPEKQEAEIAQIRQQAAGQGIANIRNSVMPFGNSFAVINAKGEPIPIWEWMKTREPTIGGPTGMAAAEAAAREYERQGGKPGVPPSNFSMSGTAKAGEVDIGAPKPEETLQQVLPGVQFGKTSAQFAKREPELIMGLNSEANKKISENYAIGTALGADKARESNPMLNEMAVNTANILKEKGLGAPGATFYERANLINLGNTLGRVAEPVLGFKIDFGNADSLAALNEKLSTLSAVDIARMGGAEGVEKLRLIAGALPQASMAPDAQAQLVAQLYVLSQKAKDREAHMQRYGEDSYNSYVMAGRAFDQENSTAKYMQQINLMKQAILTRPQAIKMMTTGQADPMVVEDFFKRLAKEKGIPYTPGMSRMFMGQ